MKLAVIDHIGNPGGGSRVVRALLPAFISLRPDIEITYFGNRTSIIRESIEDEFKNIGIIVKHLDSVRLTNQGLFGIPKTSFIIKTIQQKYIEQYDFLPPTLSGAVHKELENIVKGFDLAFFPWPYLLRCPLLKCPMVGIFHDFNFKYYFTGPHTFNKWQLEILNKEIPVWIQRSTPVVSTYFMAEELEKFYPKINGKIKVVHLAPMSTLTKITKEEAKKIVSDFRISMDFILYPTNLCSHKNIGPLLAALPILKSMGHNILLVLTGPDTETINGHACDVGIVLEKINKDVFGLGYVSNEQMDSLIQNASVVVSTSLYEAGNGPGIDAWVRGVPVAMSNIPAFLEHIKVQDVRAEVFDPRSPVDIANKIHNILSNPKKAKADAIHSQMALGKMTWRQTAEKYLDIFDESIREYSGNDNSRRRV